MIQKEAIKYTKQNKTTGEREKKPQRNEERKKKRLIFNVGEK